jgi:SNF family Na+-dependent transporter
MLLFLSSSGLGYAAQVITIYGYMTYIVVLAWSFHYLFSSFTVDLPWANCNNDWNAGIYNIGG